MKYFTKILVLLAVFCGAVWFFTDHMSVESYSVQKAVDAGESTFPTVSMLLENQKEVNILYGYSGTINVNNFRDTVMALDTTDTISLLIREKKTVVKKVSYEVIDVSTGEVLCTNSISALESNKEGKIAKLKITGDLEAGKEYSLKVTLVTDASKKIHYFSRIKPIDTPYLTEKISFIEEFHQATFDKEKFPSYKSYLELDATKAGKSLLDVNLHSSVEKITWGTMKPKMVSEVVPTIKEINADTISVQLKYLVKGTIEKPESEIVDITDPNEKILEPETMYVVTEFYRVRYTAARVYLLKWNRSMEALYDFTSFDPKAAVETGKNYINLGLIKEKETQAVSTDDNTKLAFVDHGTLWYYDLTENKIVSVLTYQDQIDRYYTSAYDSYNIKILDMNNSGDINFIVYGYVSEGDYEGKVGMILYQYLAEQDRIEEQMFIPIERPYGVIESEMDGLYYLSEQKVFYFSMNNSLYSYNINTRKLSVISNDVTTSSLVLSTKGHFVAWQDKSNTRKNQGLTILDLETEQNYRITSEGDTNVSLLAMTDMYVIYGYVKKSNIGTTEEGATVYPMSEIYIVDSRGNLLKNYKPNKGFVTSVKVSDTSIDLTLMKKAGDNTYKEAGKDYIVNKVTEQKNVVAVKSVQVATGYKEMRILLPTNFSSLLLSEKQSKEEELLRLDLTPKVVKAKGTMITHDTTVQVQTSNSSEVRYYAYTSGMLQNVYKKAADAIRYADDNMGVVVDSNNHIIWERGETETSAELVGITGVGVSSNVTSKAACVSMMLKYNHIGVSAEELSEQNGSAYDLLRDHLGYLPVNLTGSKLSQVLYYVSHKKPVLAMKNKEEAVLITAYTESSVTYYDPSARKSVTKRMKEAESLFESAGNTFISYAK